MTSYLCVLLLLEKLKESSIDLTINTTSLGEMTDDMQNYYIENIERIEKSFYSVNIKG